LRNLVHSSKCNQEKANQKLKIFISSLVHLTNNKPFFQFYFILINYYCFFWFIIRLPFVSWMRYNKINTFYFNIYFEFSCTINKNFFCFVIIAYVNVLISFSCYRLLKCASFTSIAFLVQLLLFGCNSFSRWTSLSSDTLFNSITSPGPCCLSYCTYITSFGCFCFIRNYISRFNCFIQYNNFTWLCWLFQCTPLLSQLFHLIQSFHVVAIVYHDVHFSF
jgi:hypothetical protein